MPTITEENESDLFAVPAETDFSQLLDLGDAGQDDFGLGTAADVALTTCPTHQSFHCNCYGSMAEWDLPQPAPDPYAGLEEPDYSRFENWIPKFVRPEQPCDYCRSRRLNCYKTRGEAKCTACSTLFRECSLEAHDAIPDIPEFALDTLHVVDEDTVKERGTVTGIKQLKSKGRGSSATTSVRPDDEPGSSKRNGIRFPRHAVKTLRDWVDAHADNPYPTEEEKAELEKKTELKPSQIANWLANARRRRKVSDKASRPRVCASPSLGPPTPAIDIPGIEAPKPWDELNPFERWRHSPPENEPANILDIADAMASTTPLDDVSTSPSTLGRRKNRSSNGSGFSNNIRAPSSTSLETSSLSASNSAHFSNHSSQSHGSFGSFSSSLAGKRDRRRRKRAAPATSRKPSDDKKRIFQCTFCTDTFKSKYDWTRHEKSLHLSLEKWICAPLGPVITDPATGEKRCVHCDQLDPTEDHLETHNHRQCEEKGMDARTFYRKDHLRQHLRLMHGCEMTPFMENWKSVAVNINSRCGFCAQRFTVWTERVDHLTAHFKAGARMSEWKGCRGLDPAVAAQVTNAMPPYLIGVESKSPVPYSATKRATWNQGMGTDFGMTTEESATTFAAIEESHNSGGKATCWEILTVRLGKFANETAQKGIVITDEMLQAEARRILYDSDDAWNQTAADNPEWLDLFKKAHGLDFIPSQIGGQGRHIPEDLETYGDLGLRIPFCAQLKAYNQGQAAAVAGSSNCKQMSGLLTMDEHANISQELRTIYRQLANEGVLHGTEVKCDHLECEKNIIDVGAIDSAAKGPKKLRWCIYTLPQEKAMRLSDMAAIQGFKPPVTPEQMAAEEQVRQRSANFHRSLEALIKMDDRLDKMRRNGGGSGTHTPSEKVPDPNTRVMKKNYLQRHKYELPLERAQLFATTTPPWEDSGNMPPAFSTEARIFHQEGTTTGAIAEFLGGNMSNHLPFTNDAATSEIPFSAAEDMSWAVPKTAEEEQQLIADFDRLIAETTAAQEQQAMLAPTMDVFPPATTMASEPMDMSMNMANMNFDDFEMDFDGVFDMPMDETFVPTTTAGM